MVIFLIEMGWVCGRKGIGETVSQSSQWRTMAESLCPLQEELVWQMQSQPHTASWITFLVILAATLLEWHTAILRGRTACSECFLSFCMDWSQGWLRTSLIVALLFPSDVSIREIKSWATMSKRRIHSQVGNEYQSANYVACRQAVCLL